MSMASNRGDSEDRTGSLFEPTRWSLIFALRDGSPPQAAAARDELYRIYWHPAYSVIRARGYPVHDAQDLAQGFFYAHLLEKNAFQAADPQRGRFRHFLLATLRNDLNNQHDRACAHKRCPQQPLVSLEDAETRYQAAAAIAPTEGMVFDRQWAQTIVDQALSRVRTQQAARNRAEWFEALKDYLSREPVDGEYDVLAARFRVQNKAVAMGVSRLRKDYRLAVMEIIRSTVNGQAEAEEELKYLIEVLSR